MVDTEGPVEIASSRGDRGKDRKVDLIVGEMRRYNVKVTALQDTSLGVMCIEWQGVQCSHLDGRSLRKVIH